MSAEKCGAVLTPEMLEEAANRAIGEGMRMPERVVSVRAYRMLEKIRHKFPDFDPFFDAEIWYKAYTMGLTEDE